MRPCSFSTAASSASGGHGRVKTRAGNQQDFLRGIVTSLRGEASAAKRTTFRTSALANAPRRIEHPVTRLPP